MARVKTAIITRKKHKKILKRAKGYYGAKHYRFRMAKQQVMKSGNYAFTGRKDKKSIAYKAGYKNICEIGKERIRRAGKKIADENTQIEMGQEDKKPLDIGFKVFKLDSSNLKEMLPRRQK